jgi:hypothetical protein
MSVLFDQLRPENVLCMGTGYLNDIPMEMLAATGAKVHLVDWLADVSRQAYLYDLVQLVEQKYNCFVCCNAQNPMDYCRNYALKTTTAANNGMTIDHPAVCDNFRADEARPPHCRAYLPGVNPLFHDADVTQGRAVDFVEQIPRLIAGTKTPRRSFVRAVSKLKSMNSHCVIPVEDGVIDVITTSMVASQFEFEPFGYFLRCVLDKFGGDAVQKTARNLPELEIDLRNDLFRYLLEGHCQEILRLLRPDGRGWIHISSAI